MKRESGKVGWQLFVVLLFLIFLLPLPVHAANSTTGYDLRIFISKTAYATNETMPVFGYLYNITSNSTTNVSTPMVNVSINVTILNSSNIAVISSKLLNTTSDGTFHSRNEYYTTAVLITAPLLAGNYTINSTYKNSTNSTWSSSASFNVISNRVDTILLQPDKTSYYAGESITLLAKAVQEAGGNNIGIANFTINGHLRKFNETIVSSFNCTTNSRGECSVILTAPTTSGKYILESNNFIGYTIFDVVPFDIDLYIKDSTLTSYKNVFRTGEAGYVEVRVTYNSTTPTGTYNASGVIYTQSGATVYNMSSTILNSTAGYTGNLYFAVNSGFNSSVYRANITVAKSGGETLSAVTTFSVSDWSMSVEKRASNSGFDSGYTAFLNSTVFFNVYPLERQNGTVLLNMTTNITSFLKTSIGFVINTTNTTYNASCGATACYQFSFALPDIVGTYTVLVQGNYTSVIRSEIPVRVTNITATASTINSEGEIKELFGVSEFVFVRPKTKNQTAEANATVVAFGSLRYENGTEISYSEGNWTGMNMTDSVYEWSWNSTLGMLKLDPPKVGGSYIMEIYVENRSASAFVKFGVNPYDICASPKGSEDTSVSNYWWQFKTTDIIYFYLTINEAQNPTGRITNTTKGFNTTGQASACSFDTTTKRAVLNATLNVEKALNMDTGNEEALNTTSSVCKSVDASGGYLCTVQAFDNRWDGGRHAVIIKSDSPDGTSDRVAGTFETRAFYIYGYSTTWVNKKTSNITLNIYMYEAGDGWWSNSAGISGTATLEKVSYSGDMGEWIWPPIDYDYNVTGMNTTVTNGRATLVLPASKTGTGTWKSGQFSAVIKGTVNGVTDYGQAWFGIRNWDVYASPIEYNNNTNAFEYKYSLNNKQNVSLYVRVTEAGTWNDNGRTNLGQVNISVKKIQDYSTWPPKEFSTTNYTATSISVNETSPWYSSANGNFTRYMINISPTRGIWDSGYYNVVLDVNKSETGYGWFNVIAFYANAQPVNKTGTSTYYSKGDTPLYFNVTTTKSQKWNNYQSSDFINTTVVDAVLRTWDSATNTQRELNTPENFNISPMNVNGSQILMFNYTAGSWPSGYYYGELVLNDSDGAKATAWLWTSIMPFRITANSLQSVVSMTGNASYNVSIYQPEWYWTVAQPGNYTVSKVSQRVWSYNGYSDTVLNTSPSSTQLTNHSFILNISPPGGRWTGGWRSLIVTVKDNNTNSTQETWLSFRATPFSSSVSRTSAQLIGTSTNATVNITLSNPAGGNASAAGNLSEVYYWGWPSRTTYAFSVPGCSSAVNGSCLINGSAIVNIAPPSSGWSESYNYIYFKFTESGNAASIIENWDSVWFESRPAITAYMYPVSNNGYYEWRTDKRGNITMYMYSIRDLDSNTMRVNITNVQYALSPSGCWDDNCRVYSDATWEVVWPSSGVFRNNGTNEMLGAGWIRINSSSGTWSLGDYYVKVTVSSGSTSATIKNANFRIADMTAPNVTMTNPVLGGNETGSTITYSATTSEDARCYVQLFDFDYYYAWTCGSSNATNATSANIRGCNNLTYDSSGYHYLYLTDGYYSWYNGTTSNNITSQAWGSLQSMTTGGTSHTTSFSTTNMPSQDYGVKYICYDSDWNYGFAGVAFTLNKTSG